MSEIDIGDIAARLASVEQAISKLLSFADPSLASRVSSLETTVSGVVGTHLPGIRDDLVSLKASVDALAPGLSTAAEQGAEGLASEGAQWIEGRLSALETWATNLGQAAHNKFAAPKPETPPAPANPVDAGKAS